MTRTCSAPTCSERSIKGASISFHKFPRDPQLKRLWEIATGNDSLPKYPILCARHFTDDCFDMKRLSGTRALKKGAIPTIFTNCFDSEIFTNDQEPVDEMDPLALDRMQECDHADTIRRKVKWNIAQNQRYEEVPSDSSTLTANSSASVGNYISDFEGFGIRTVSPEKRKRYSSASSSEASPAKLPSKKNRVRFGIDVKSYDSREPLQGSESDSATLSATSDMEPYMSEQLLNPESDSATLSAISDLDAYESKESLTKSQNDSETLSAHSDSSLSSGTAAFEQPSRHTNPVFYPRKGKYLNPRYVSDFDISEMKSSKKANRNWKLAKREIIRKRIRIYKLDESNKRMKTRIYKLERLLAHLKQNGRVTEAAESSSMVSSQNGSIFIQSDFFRSKT